MDETDIQRIVDNADYFFLAFWLLVWLPTDHYLAACCLLFTLGKIMKKQWWPSA